LRTIHSFHFFDKTHETVVLLFCGRIDRRIVGLYMYAYGMYIKSCEISMDRELLRTMEVLFAQKPRESQFRKTYSHNYVISTTYLILLRYSSTTTDNLQHGTIPTRRRSKPRTQVDPAYTIARSCGTYIPGAISYSTRLAAFNTLYCEVHWCKDT